MKLEYETYLTATTGRVGKGVISRFDEQREFSVYHGFEKRPESVIASVLGKNPSVAVQVWCGRKKLILRLHDLVTPPWPLVPDARIRFAVYGVPPVVTEPQQATPTCMAHGLAACPTCSRTRKPARYPFEGKNCPGCLEYARTGMHWDTCPNRDTSPIKKDPVKNTYEERQWLRCIRCGHFRSIHTEDGCVACSCVKGYILS